MQFIRQAIDTLLPPRCAVSGEIVAEQGMTAPHIWRDLDFIATPFCPTCGVPFDYDVEEKTICAACITAPPPYTTARAALIYNDHSRKLILGFKYSDKLYAVKSFTPWLERVGAEALSQADALIPVPLHYWRMVRRRYNQAAIIADDLGDTVGLPVVKQALIRTKATKAQGYLNPDERLKNIRGAFAIHPKYKEQIQGKTLIIIDDVYTTGVTVKECARILLKAGAKEIHVLAVARVNKTDPIF